MWRTRKVSNILAKLAICAVIFAPPVSAGADTATSPAAQGATPANSARDSHTMTTRQARDAALAGDVVLVDIRTPDEWAQSGVPDVATPLDMTRRGFIDKLLALRKEKPDARLGLICATGGRSAYLAGWLRRNGIAGVVDVPAGMHARGGWLENKLPVKQVTKK